MGPRKYHIPFRKKLRYLLTSSYSGGAFAFLICSLFALEGFLDYWNPQTLLITPNAPTTQGVVIKVREVGGYFGDKGDMRFLITYLYSVPGEDIIREGEAYALLLTENKKRRHVTVRYSERFPQVSTAVGMEAHHFHGILFTVFGALFTVGGILFLGGTYEKFKQLHVLKRPVLTYGRLTHKKKESSSELTKLLFEYKTKDGTLLKSLIFSDRVKELSDEKDELLIYHELDPEKIVLVDDFPPYIQKDLRDMAERQIGAYRKKSFQ